MATRANTTLYDRAAIMRRAWAIYRNIHATYGDWQIARGIVDGSFAAALRKAWAEARQEARKAVALTGPNGDRISALREQIEMLDYRSFRYGTEAERTALQSEILALEAA